MLTASYDLQWLGVLSGSDNFSSAQGISDAGQIVGDSYVADANGIPGQEKAFSWTASSGMTDMGALNGNAAYAWDVNNSGDITGWYHYPVSSPGTTAGGGYYEWAYVARNGVPQTIPGYAQIGMHSVAYGVNDNHIVVGHADMPNSPGLGEAFSYDGATLRFLGTLGGKWSYAMDINNSNVIAGFADTGLNPTNQPGVYVSRYHAAIWNNGVIQDLGTLGSDSYAYKINDLGQAVGSSIGTDNQYHAFVWDGTQMTALPGLTGNSEALSINNQGQIVGDTGNWLNSTAFVYESGAVYDLNSLVNGGVGADKLMRANDINNLGQIVGFGVHNGHKEAFLLTPAGVSSATGGISATAQANPTPAVPALTVTGGTFVFDGTAHEATANVYSADGATPVSGSITLTYDGSTTPPTNAGVYAVVATFVSVDPNYGNATADAMLTIQRATPEFSNLSSPEMTSGAAQTLVSGHIAAAGVAPAGENVTVTLNGVAQLAQVDASGDFNTQFDASSLPAGSYKISYEFSGSANFNAAASASSVLIVHAPANGSVSTELELESSTPVSAPGQPVTLSAQVTADGVAGLDPPGGVVTFSEGDVVLGTATVDGGFATLSLPFASVGQHVISASYSGDAHYAASTASLVQTVQYAVLEAGDAPGTFVLAVGASAYRDVIHVETWNRGTVDAYHVELEGKAAGQTAYEYDTSAKAPGEIVEIVVYDAGANDRVSIETHHANIPVRYVGGTGHNGSSSGSIASHPEQHADAAVQESHATASTETIDAVMTEWGSHALSVGNSGEQHGRDVPDRFDVNDLETQYDRATDAVHAAHLQQSDQRHHAAAQESERFQTSAANAALVVGKTLKK